MSRTWIGYKRENGVDYMQMRDYVRKDIGTLGVKEDAFYVTVEWRYDDGADADGRCENWRVEVLAPGGVLTDDAGEAEVLSADEAVRAAECLLDEAHLRGIVLGTVCVIGADDGLYYKQMWE